MVISIGGISFERFAGIGISIICGFILGKLISRFNIPSVAGYIIAGLILGQSTFKVFSIDFLDRVGSVSDLALAFISFSIGGELLLRTLKKIGIKIIIIAFFEAFCTFILVTLAVLLFNQPLSTALLLGAVASATAPAATIMVIEELRAKGPLTSTLLAVVAVDDGICLMIYAVAASIARVLISHTGTFSLINIVIKPLIEIGGSFALGIGMGLFLVFILGKVSFSREILAVVAAAILVTHGIATQLGLSALLSNMTLGVIVVNFSSSRTKAFSVIDSVTSPIYTAFFVLAGARLQISLLAQIGLLGLAYAVARMLGKVAGASIGARIAKSEPTVKKYIGLGLFSQMGVAVGLAIIIGQEFAGTDIGNIVITILLATTVLTEIIGPLSTRFALIKAGEAGKAGEIAE